MTAINKKFSKYSIVIDGDKNKIWSHMATQYGYGLYQRLSNLGSNIEQFINQNEFMKTYLENEYYSDEIIWQKSDYTGVVLGGYILTQKIINLHFFNNDSNKFNEPFFLLRIELAAVILAARVADGQKNLLSDYVKSFDNKYMGLSYDEIEQTIDYYDLGSSPEDFCDATGVKIK